MARMTTLECDWASWEVEERRSLWRKERWARELRAARSAGWMFVKVWSRTMVVGVEGGGGHGLKMELSWAESTSSSSCSITNGLCPPGRPLNRPRPSAIRDWRLQGQQTRVPGFSATLRLHQNGKASRRKFHPCCITRRLRSFTSPIRPPSQRQHREVISPNQCEHAERDGDGSAGPVSRPRMGRPPPLGGQCLGDLDLCHVHAHPRLESRRPLHPLVLPK